MHTEEVNHEWMNGLTVALFVLMVFSTYGCMDKDVMKDGFFHTFLSSIAMISTAAFIIHIITLL